MRLKGEASNDQSSSASDRRPRRRRRGGAVTNWVSGGGLAAFLFALPLLLVFTAFSWYPMVRLVILSLQDTDFSAIAGAISTHGLTGNAMLLIGAQVFWAVVLWPLVARLWSANREGVVGFGG